jgi:hypothetical protein
MPQIVLDEIINEPSRSRRLFPSPFINFQNQPVNDARANNILPLFNVRNGFIGRADRKTASLKKGRSAAPDRTPFQ